MMSGSRLGESTFRVFVTPASLSTSSEATTPNLTPNVSSRFLQHAHPSKNDSDAGPSTSGLSFEAHGDGDEVLSEVSVVEPFGGFRRYAKMALLCLLWLTFTAILMIKSEKDSKMRQVSIPGDSSSFFEVRDMPSRDVVEITLQGSILPQYYANLTDRRLNVWLEQRFQLPDELMGDVNESDFHKRVSTNWAVPLVSDNMIGVVPELLRSKVFKLDSFQRGVDVGGRLFVCLQTNVNSSLPVAIKYDVSPIDESDGTVYAVVVLIGLYVLIIFELVHRTLAAMLASTMSVAILAFFNERPSMAELVSWIDVETLLLLFSMMVIVAILSETGVFDYLAVQAFKMTGGRIWPLINTLCLFTALLSAFLDNVTVSLLMTPVSIRLCEVMELNAVPVLMAMVIYSNIGGTATAVGDPPNVIIASNQHVKDAGIDFTKYMMHMSTGVAFIMVATNLQLRFIYRNINDLRIQEPHDVTELKHEIAVWQRAAASVSSYSKDEDAVRETLLKKVRRLAGELKMKMKGSGIGEEAYKTTLEELQRKYPIRDKALLAKSGLTLVFVIVVFFLHSIPELSLSLGWTAFLGAILLLILADNENLEGVLARVEWSTLLFFAALFVLMEALSKLGLIAWIGRQTEDIILSVPNQSIRLAVAVLLVLWVSALASAFVDNIPLTSMMIKIVTSICANKELGLPLPPLVWALAFGACLGGNGTLIGASANVVCAGVAEQHGYRFTFLQFFKVGFPVMLVSVVTASIYLLVAHIVFQWH